MSSTPDSAEEAPTSLSRLWPDPSDVIRAVTQWQPPIVVTLGDAVEFHGRIQCHESERRGNKNPLLRPTKNRGALPRQFGTVDEIMETLAQPLINEGLCALNKDYDADKYGNGRWNRDIYSLRLTKLTQVSPIFRSKSYFCGDIKTYEAQFSAHGETILPPSSLSELYCIYFPGWEESKFGIVAHDFPTTISFRQHNEGQALLKLLLVVHPNENDTRETGWLSQKDLKVLLDPHKKGLEVANTLFTLMSCGSTTNVVRQFEAIKCLPYLKPHLQKALLTSHITNSPKHGRPRKPHSLPQDIWVSLVDSHNKDQLLSISQVLTGSCRDNVCLVQGPPGTGKSSTIVGLVSALLSGKAPLPKAKESGCLIHPGKSMGATWTEPKARNRILVCAATNQAVDSLAWKIKKGSLGPSGKVGQFGMARFGSLPSELSRDSDDKPELSSEMENFLYEINVDRKASNGIQEFDHDLNDSHDEVCWSPEKRKTKRRKRRKIMGRSALRSKILGNSSVVVSTLSGAGSKAFVDAVCRDPTRNDSEFDAVIIDEACQASEPESLIPFKYNPTTITLVGDPKQLPVLTHSDSLSSSKLFECSLFERLQSLNFPTIFLRTQYRMHEDIAAFPSKQFYHGKLITPASVKARPEPSWLSCPCFPTICFWDTRQDMAANPLGYGYRNSYEADFIVNRILCALADSSAMRSNVEVTVGIISFYKDQVHLLKEEIANIPLLLKSRLKIKVATVDGFQGSECDIIILSCVRSHSCSTQENQGSIGFLNKSHRVNVALTRAKCSLWIVGNAAVLKGSDLWRALLQHFDSQGVLRHEGDFQDLFTQWKASQK